MKFLCVTCDEAMKLTDAKPPDRGSLTVVYRCPGCAHEIAMLTNPYETQVVGSLGVRVGPEADGAAKCPFPGVMEEMGASLDGASAAFASADNTDGSAEWDRPFLVERIG